MIYRRNLTRFANCIDQRYIRSEKSVAIIIYVSNTQPCYFECKQNKPKLPMDTIRQHRHSNGNVCRKHNKIVGKLQCLWVTPSADILKKVLIISSTRNFMVLNETNFSHTSHFQHIPVR